MKPHERLAQGRKQKNLTMQQLADLAGTTNQQIDRLEKGKRTLTKEWAEKLAPHLGMTPQHLLFGHELSTDVDNSKRIASAALKVVGYVEAGAWRDVTAGEFLEREVLLPRDGRFPVARQYVLEVRGDSMDAAKPVPIVEGALLRCVDFVDAGLSLKDGQIAIVQRTRDGGHLVETTVKRVAMLPDRIELRPESTNPAHKPLIWNEETERRGETRVIAIVTAVVNELATL